MNKRSLKSLLIVCSVLLMFLPFILTFNNILTRIFENFTLYTFLQEKIIPFEIRVVGLIVGPFVKTYIPVSGGMIVNNFEYRMSWNCLGWQSLILFIGSLFVGLFGNNYTFSSKLETIFVGIFGIFWVNIIRLVFIVILGTLSQQLYRIVFHDILASVVTILYLFLFWWFSYRYILEEKPEK